ncbi:MAG: hypothetical protein A3B99_01610 [Candidatus Yanofskybacteria bacterium RIFCSPHIGHO2_02_FULL_44_12b]|uniref:Uncharacterized protein n=1 Tax=Candidatus Yanofskybacteria bacterium RIFCSPLOWO2_01_FULL_44_22 TaxID=1802697 RepID=A0A1F8GLI5_9BACT|nr:MAG: hypothetical protein A2659_04750 [Candidatus Yanofskybacteria bacterium RIFCSPHIGHO2_01_FULL_44_24]OGN16230.1 MAG: hypothetical protein A3B99_01610 [Candidatus Yanofskybacteria bacterium RIFCSPHIGHO2_02_FULL_44_12b]OGN25578.1 MAG: hypothetical protein A2925_05155 [Candidatus Yanofskybacteria bacterium RIFCSPLOWO2_01_FULL_44_22]
MREIAPEIKVPTVSNRAFLVLVLPPPAVPTVILLFGKTEPMIIKRETAKKENEITNKKEKMDLKASDMMPNIMGV